jgi:hypothetical protein
MRKTLRVKAVAFRSPYTCAAASFARPAELAFNVRCKQCAHTGLEQEGARMGQAVGVVEGGS